MRWHFAALSVHYCVNMLKAIESLCFGKSPALTVMYRLPFNKLWASCSFLPPAFHSIDPQKTQGQAAPFLSPHTTGCPHREWCHRAGPIPSTGFCPPHPTHAHREDRTSLTLP